jgi:hypothetical protein
VSSSLNHIYSNCHWNTEIADTVDRIGEMDQWSAQISLDRGNRPALWVKKSYVPSGWKAEKGMILIQR